MRSTYTGVTRTVGDGIWFSVVNQRGYGLLIIKRSILSSRGTRYFHLFRLFRSDFSSVWTNLSFPTVTARLLTDDYRVSKTDFFFLMSIATGTFGILDCSAILSNMFYDFFRRVGARVVNFFAIPIGRYAAVAAASVLTRRRRIFGGVWPRAGEGPRGLFARHGLRYSSGKTWYSSSGTHDKIENVTRSRVGFFSSEYYK